MSNPLKDFLEMKQAAQLSFPGMGSGLGQVARNVGRNIGNEAQKATGAAVAGLGVAAAGAAVHKIYDALTKRRDFRAMLEHNPHLAEAQAQDPKRFNQLYSTLRTMNPEFAKDPIVAGSYMDRMVQNPAGVGGMAGELLNARDKVPAHVSDTFHSALLKGIGSRQS